MEQTLTSNYWLLRLNLQGGRIVELKYKGEQILGTFERIDGKTGNAHLCLPNFGSEGQGKYDLPFHGPARTIVWRVAGASYQTENSIILQGFLPATSGYKAELSISQEFVLEKGIFKHTTTVKNLLGEPVPVNIGVHNYWSAPLGWEEARLNGEQIADKVRANGFSHLREENLVELPGKVSYRWATRGFREAVLWTGRKDGEYDQKYLCIEPVIRYDNLYFGSKESILPRNKTITAAQMIIP